MAQKGRPRKKVDPDTVFQLACIGASISQIADDHFRVSHDTIERRFRQKFEQGKSAGQPKTLTVLYQRAMGGSMRALELFLVNKCGWSLRPDMTINVNAYCRGSW